MDTAPHIWVYGEGAAEPDHLDAVLTAFAMQTEIQAATAHDVVMGLAEASKD